MQSVGTWIAIYFYPIIFIGAFFLLNLTLAVIKAKFTEEMNNKKETGGPAKKKKLDDAAKSSEDEDLRAQELQDQIDAIKVSKQMSPRSKENLINKFKIEFMIQKVDNAFDKKEISHKIIERTDEDDRKAFGRSNLAQKSFYNSHVDKIGILQPAQKTLSYALPRQKGNSKSKVQPQMNYSDVFYSDKRTVFHLGKSPRENLRDIFSLE